ncbi:MAG: STAS domain-containing protein [Phycisphaerae bacterium]|nr:STAS domain-containing protein [Phycisphaerae bacterium]
MQIAETVTGAVSVLVPQGPLSGADAKMFRDAAIEATVRRRGRVIIDASGIPFADSDGLEALLDVADALSVSGRALKICQPADTVREALVVTGIVGLFEFYPDVNAAVRSFL